MAALERGHRAVGVPGRAALTAGHDGNRGCARQDGGAAMYEVYGALGSPYSLKMRAVMRYRRLPHVWAQVGLNPQVRAKVKVPVIPVIRFGEDDWRNDST